MQAFLNKAKVAVLLRTKNREKFLVRALESISAQSFPDWCACVVDDGANPKRIEEILAPYQKKFPGKFSLLHSKRDAMQGLGYLLNLAIQNTKSEFIAIHDDDDSWHPHFLARCMEEIKNYPAIVTQSMLVAETMCDDVPVEMNRTLYNAWQKNALSLFRMAEGTIFPSISFLFRRNILEQVGLYNEDLQQKEDWEFSLRFFSMFPIHFLEEALANFHYRAELREGPWANLLMDQGQHYATETEIRNNFLRKDLQEGKMGLGYLTAFANNRGQLFKELKNISHTTENVISSLAKRKDSFAVSSLASSESIHIGYAINDAFAFPLAVSIRSLAENYLGSRPVVVHIIGHQVSSKNKCMVEKSLPESSKVEVQWLEADWSRISEIPCEAKFSFAAFGRMLFPVLLGKEIQKILYIDADTLVLDDISHAFDKNCSAYALMAVQDITVNFQSPSLHLTHLERFGIKASDKYFNSGVLLMNLGYWRNHSITKNIFDFALSNPEFLHLQDQNILNIFLHNKIGEMDFSWNFQVADRNIREGGWIFPHISQSSEKPKILHFFTAEKPWLPGVERPFKKLYLEFASRTVYGLSNELKLELR